MAYDSESSPVSTIVDKDKWQTENWQLAADVSAGEVAKPEKKPKRPKKPMSEKQLAHMARMRELAAESRLEKQKLKDLEAEQEATTARVDIQELKTEQIRKTKPRRQTPKSPPPSPKPSGGSLEAPVPVLDPCPPSPLGLEPPEPLSPSPHIKV